MKTNMERGEQQVAPRRAPRRRRILAALAATSALAGGLVAREASADALARITAISGAANEQGLQPAVRLNPPKRGLANHKVYMIGDSLTAGLTQAGIAQYAATKGWDLTPNGYPSRSLYIGCDVPNTLLACSTISDGITQLKVHAPEAAKSCTHLVWLGVNQGERSNQGLTGNQVYSQKTIEIVDLSNRIWDEDPEHTCPVGQRINGFVDLTYGPHAPAGFAAQMDARSGILYGNFSIVYGVGVIPLKNYVDAEHLLDSSADSVHFGFNGYKKAGEFIVNYLPTLEAAVL